MTALAERASNQVARTAGNRMIGAAAVSAREQRERLDGAIDSFGQAVQAATVHVETMTTRMERRFARSIRRLLLVVGGVLCLMVLAAGALVEWRTGCHPVGGDCRAVQFRPADGRPLRRLPSALPR